MPSIMRTSKSPTRFSRYFSLPTLVWQVVWLNIIPFGSVVAAHIPLDEQHALSCRRFPGIVVGFSDKHTHSLRIWNPVLKRVKIRGTIKYLGCQPQPTITYSYSQAHFPSSEDPTLSLSIQSSNTNLLLFLLPNEFLWRQIEGFRDPRVKTPE